MRFFPVVSTLASLAAIAAAKDCWIGPGYEETAFQKCMEPKVQACPYGADGRTDEACGVAASEECAVVGDCNLPMRNAADIDNAKRTPDCWIGPGYEETAFQKCMEPKVQACPYGADGRTDEDCGVAASEECAETAGCNLPMRNALEESP